MPTTSNSFRRRSRDVAKRGRPPLNAPPPDSELPDLLELWNRATIFPWGIVIASDRPNALAQRLYAARRACGHNAYAGLKVVEDTDKVWIVPR